MEKTEANPFIIQPAPWPYYAEDEIEAVTQVLKSGKVNYWTGEHGVAFEREFAAHLGVPYAVAVANGSVALELALYAVGILPCIWGGGPVRWKKLWHWLEHMELR